VLVSVGALSQPSSQCDGSAPRHTARSLACWRPAFQQRGMHESLASARWLRAARPCSRVRGAPEVSPLRCEGILGGPDGKRETIARRQRAWRLRVDLAPCSIASW
jgi:hypothetical protein